MPHRCMECNSVLESRELNLGTGCPVCGGKKFEYVRPQKAMEADLRKMTVSQYVAYAGSADADEAEPEHEEKPKHKEHKAAPKPAEEPKSKAKKPAAHEGRIDSVRILEKGNYDLNLPMLLNRKELVMSKEEGVYHVDLPSALKTTPKPSKKKKR
ncbi:conserved hypothetical protein [Methanocella paludicola SANAE]|uniref:Zn-ribbon containing protein n=1 Tax=Methanocella paludicola (strain DSM 17711 / JCM 13418 / NBRC 101707 / SANAE) TaxID=304371 RepID=D1YVA2_METPS|nr:Zn-ribbon domain-containing protein [Methanocella paludicola]BAI60374.1 conserved hypothetical protein [Methanocella paludicola SANAE]